MCPEDLKHAIRESALNYARNADLSWTKGKRLH